MPSRDDADANDGSGDAGSVTTFDPETDAASQAVVTAVAALADTDPSALSPLYDVVEPDAIDSLCEHAQRVGDGTVHRLWFGYEGFDVCVRSDGQIRVLESSSTASQHATSS